MLITIIIIFIIHYIEYYFEVPNNHISLTMNLIYKYFFLTINNVVKK